MDARRIIEEMAGRYVWWRSAAEAAAMPDRVILQVMDIGDWEDVQALADALGDDRLRAALSRAEAGQLRPKSWAYWHYRLGLAASPDELPPMPRRMFS